MHSLVQLYRPYLRLALCLATCFALSKYIDFRIESAPQELADKIFLDNYNNVYRVSGLLNPAGGTGVALYAASGKKVILTNRHVCQVIGPSVMMTNSIFGGPSQVLYMDDKADLCVIDFPPHIPVAKIPFSSLPARGNEIVHAVGYPLDHDKNLSSGLVLRPVVIEVFTKFANQTNCTRVFDFNKEKLCATDKNLLVTNMSIFPGNSGSPVFNNKNELVGLVNAAHPRSGFGTMVLLSEIKRVLNKF